MDIYNECGTAAGCAMSFVHGRGPVFYAARPSSKTRPGCEASGIEDKNQLIAALLECLTAWKSPLLERLQSHGEADVPFQVVRGIHGRPRLRLGDYEGPAVSFSEYGGNLWAALCGDESDIGIDVAVSAEFDGDYPFQRVFHPQELLYALRLAGGDVQTASALLWSIKEAVVKALGSAFHLLDPRDITVYPSKDADDGRYTHPVGLSGKALARFPNHGSRAIWVRSLPRAKMWLSIALVSGQN